MMLEIKASGDHIEDRDELECFANSTKNAIMIESISERLRADYKYGCHSEEVENYIESLRDFLIELRQD